LLATTDGGVSWAAIQPGLPAQAGHDPQVKLTFVDTQHGAAVGGYPVRAWLTHDGGRTWQNATQPGQISYADAGTLWVVGDHLDRSDDGGNTWTEEDVGPFHAVRVQFVTRSNRWLTVTRPGTFLITHDGGRTWQQVWPQVLQSPAPAGPQR
jgi:photosystem II stability/assembly factor-like uncharacterized protein